MLYKFFSHNNVGQVNLRSPVCVSSYLRKRDASENCFGHVGQINLRSPVCV